MKKLLPIFILCTMSLWANASFLYQEIDPICSISGTTHTSFPWEISDTSSWSIPKAYDGECIPTEDLSSLEKRKIYTIMIDFLKERYYLDDNVNSGYVVNMEGREFLEDRFFPRIQKFIWDEVKSSEPNLKHIAILNYAVSLIGYDYFIDSMNLSGEYTGLTIEAAQELARENGVMFRIVQEDGEYYAVTMDYRPGRINAVVEDGIIVSYTVE